MVSVLSVEYDDETNTVTAILKSASGPSGKLEIDAVAFAELVGLAKLKQAVIQRRGLSEMPMLEVAALQTGHVRIADKHVMSLSFLVPNLGLLHFALPPEAETILREKLTPGPQQ